jgi:hypothetical protein
MQSKSIIYRIRLTTEHFPLAVREFFKEVNLSNRLYLLKAMRDVDKVAITEPIMANINDLITAACLGTYSTRVIGGEGLLAELIAHFVTTRMKDALKEQYEELTDRYWSLERDIKGNWRPLDAVRLRILGQILNQF